MEVHLILLCGSFSQAFECIYREFVMVSRLFCYD